MGLALLVCNTPQLHVLLGRMAAVPLIEVLHHLVKGYFQVVNHSRVTNDSISVADPFHS